MAERNTKPNQEMSNLNLTGSMRMRSDRPTNQTMKDSSATSASATISGEANLLRFGKYRAHGVVAICALALIIIVGLILRYMT